MAQGKNRSGLQSRSEDRSNARRSIVACNRCRNRKTRCAGNPPYTCAACEDAGQVCVYSEAEKRVSIPESYYRQLQSQARTQLQAQAQTQNNVSRSQDSRQSSLFTTTSPTQSTPYTSTEVPFDRDDWWYQGTDHLFLNRSGEHRAWPSIIDALSWSWLTSSRICRCIVSHPFSETVASNVD